MNDRQEQLLQEIVKEYTKTAKAVGSKFLVDAYHQDLSSATIRNDMLALEKEGYLAQPYTSAGRIPTEKGYRYLLSSLDLGKKIPSGEAKNLSADLEGDARLQTKTLAKNIAGVAGNAVVVSFEHNDTFYTGLSYLFSHPEFAEQARVCTLSEVVDHLDDVMRELSGILTGETTVKLGDDNPFGEGCGLVVTKYRSGGVFGVLGPMRMDYQRNVSRVNFVRELLFS